MRVLHFLNRYPAIAASLIFVLLYVPLLIREQHILKREALFDVERHAVSQIELLSREIDFEHPFPELLSKLDDPALFEALHRQILHLLSPSGLVKVKFYDLTGKVIYSNDATVIGDEFADQGFFQAAGGVALSHIISREEYLLEYGGEAAGAMVELYVPVYGRERQEAPLYVMEAYLNFEPFRERISRILFQSAVSLAAVIAVAVTLLFFLHKRALFLQNRLESLEKVLCVCCVCKRIKDKSGEDGMERWISTDDYINRETGLDLSHGYCPTCFQNVMAELDKKFPET